MKDLEIIKRIRQNDRDKALKELYKEFPKIKSNIQSSGGDATIAREIFHDSLILLIEKVSDPKFALTSKLSTYLFGINRFLWKNELRRRNKNHELEWEDTLIINQEDLEYDTEKERKLQILEQVLKKVTEKCQQVFRLFYFEKKSMKDIAALLGFSSVNSAKTQKYKCIERVIQLAQTSNPS